MDGTTKDYLNLLFQLFFPRVQEPRMNNEESS